jgi:hypothetical protein
MKEHVQNFIIVTIAYLVAFAVTTAIIAPIQSMYLTAVPPAISLLFLPHGVRILAAYFFGWRSILYLIPSGYLTHFLWIETQHIDLDLTAPMVSVIAAYLGVKLISFIPNIGFRDFRMSAWKWLLLAGFLGSIFNGLGHGLLQKEFSLSSQMLGYAIGDVSGQFALMVCLIYYFRYTQTDYMTES